MPYRTLSYILLHICNILAWGRYVSFDPSASSFAPGIRALSRILWVTLPGWVLASIPLPESLLPGGGPEAPVTRTFAERPGRPDNPLFLWVFTSIVCSHLPICGTYRTGRFAINRHAVVESARRSLMNYGKESIMRRSPGGRLSVLAATAVCGLLLGAGATRADGLQVENAKAVRRDETTAIVQFDITWSNSWRHASFFDAAWVFFKVRVDDKSGWQPVRLAADPASLGSSGAASKVLNPAGFGQAQGTPLEFVVPDGDDGFVGMIVRRAADGVGVVDARKVTAVWDLAGNGKLNAELRAFGIEMVYIPEGPFYVGRGNGEIAPFAGKGYGGMELNWLYRHSGKLDETAEPLPFKFNIGDLYTWGVGTTKGDTPAYKVTSADAIPTGRQKGQLWAVDLTPEDGGEIPAAFPNGYAGFYCMKHAYPTAGQYADFLNALTEAQAKPRYYANGHGQAIARSGESPNFTYAAPHPDARCPWLSFTDGAVWAAWAGLRPMTELEYEKACRGPQPAIPNDATPSYWGIHDVMVLSIYERPVSIGNAIGRAFRGTHGRGTPELPPDWPPDIRGAILRSDYFFGGGHQPGHLLTAGRAPAVYANADRAGGYATSGSPNYAWTFAGWRGARSAPAGDTGVGPVTGALDLETLHAARLKEPLRADGVLDEWGEPKPAVSISSPAFVFPIHLRFPSVFGSDPWGGADDLSAKAYLAWDGEALCVAAEVTDDRHVNGQTGANIWNGDAMQVGLVNQAGDHWNVGAALTEQGAAFHQWDGRGDALTKTATYGVARDDAAGVTRYEMRLPLADIGVKPGAECSFYLMFFDDDDGKGCHHRLQWVPGKTKTFMRRLYPRFVLGE